ncbi:MAG: hypothetical protein GXO60_03825 [Epsilonproteobacteria bacterium]|nr:hypothetical protein [Campylobacterota bacterium]
MRHRNKRKILNFYAKTSIYFQKIPLVIKAETIKNIIENKDADIFIPVDKEAETL